MRAQEIITLIEWPEAMPADRRHAVEDAILALDRKAYGNGQPILKPMDAERRLRNFISKHPSNAAAARALGISRGFLYDIQCGRRPIPPAIQSAIGITRIREPERYEEI